MSLDSFMEVSLASVTSRSGCVCLLSLSPLKFFILKVPRRPQSPVVLTAFAYCCHPTEEISFIFWTLTLDINPKDIELKNDIFVGYIKHFLYFLYVLYFSLSCPLE